MIVLVLIHASFDLGFSQKSGTGVLNLIHADELITFRVQGKQFRKAVGNVIFRRGSTEMKSDQAEFLPNLNWAKFSGNVKITDPGRTLTASQVIYRTNEDLMIATGNVLIIREGSRLSADSIYYYRSDKISIGMGNAKLIRDGTEIYSDKIRFNEIRKSARAEGNALLKNIEDKTELRAGIIDYDLNLDSLTATVDPFLIKVDSTDGDTLFIRSISITGNNAISTYYAHDSVRIDRLQLHAESQSAEYNAAADIITLSEDPFAVQGGEKLMGDQILMLLEEQKVTQIYVPQNARTESKRELLIRRPAEKSLSSDTTDSLELKLTRQPVVDRLNAKTLRMYIKDNNVNRIVAAGMASSEYHMDEDGVLQGINKVSGDTIVIGFIDNDIRSILVLGGARGTFFPDKYAQGADTTIKYSAETILYNIPRETTRLKTKSTVQYQDLTLNADEVLVDWSSSILTATGDEITAPDSVIEISGDSTMTIGIPELIQKGNKPVYGKEMEYNLLTRRGKIRSGETRFQDGYYTGETILRLGPDIMTINHGYYTTCDLDEPHFYFKSRQMKLIVKDKVIARPVVLYISDVPVFALPFGVFPNRGGRHTGILIPSYGETGSDGRFLRGGGLYWAGSQYHDATFIVDFFDKKGTLFRGSSNYKKRYALNGGISASLTPRSFSDQNRRRWDLTWNHTQKIDPTINLRGNARFVSDERFYDDLSSNRNSRLNQQLRSNLTLNKRWEGSGNALSMNLSRTENLQSKIITGKLPDSNLRVSEVLPSFNFRVGRKQLFKPSSGDDQRWFNSIYYSYSNNGERKRSVTTIIDTIHTNTTVIDTIFAEKEDVKQKITHSISINSPQKIFKYFTFDPNFNYSEGWINEWNEPVIDDAGVFSYGEDGKILTDKRGTFKARRTFSTGFRMATKIYGNFAPRIGALSSIRHVITPSIGFRYTPDFSTDLYGYFTTGVDSLGNEVRYDLFQGSAIGSTPSKETRVLNYSISNTFQAKLHEAEENERKIELFSLNLNGGYNYTAEFRKMNPLSASFRTKFIPGASLDISSRYNFYRWIDGSISNEFRVIPRLTNLTFSTSFSLSGDRRTKTDVLRSDAVEQYASDNMDDRFEQLKFNDLAGETWNSRISISYALNKSNPDQTSKTFWLRGDLNFSPTRKWSVGYNYNLDLIRKIITNHSVNVQRDLHCWRFSLNWTPSGPGAGYYFIVNVKSSHLSDLKIEERGGRSSLFGR
ncbi:MAG: LPS assembly protein LptD [Candidatus Marinimicrobia bacterium]|nr:LPS assembly protein LptD [Candidatus Neomarinimicrobiota bacterium]